MTLTSRSAKRCDTPTLVINQKFEIEQRTRTILESLQHILPSSLIFVAMSKVDVLVAQFCDILRKLLQAHNHDRLWCCLPRASWYLKFT